MSKNKILILPKAEKFILNLDTEIAKILMKRISNLECNPIPKESNHILDVIKNNFLCELCFKKWRIYYIFSNKKIIIDNIIYEGKISILKGEKNHKAGTKGI